MLGKGEATASALAGCCAYAEPAMLAPCCTAPQSQNCCESGGPPADAQTSGSQLFHGISVIRPDDSRSASSSLHN